MPSINIFSLLKKYGQILKKQVIDDEYWTTLNELIKKSDQNVNNYLKLFLVMFIFLRSNDMHIRYSQYVMLEISDMAGFGMHSHRSIPMLIMFCETLEIVPCF